MLLRRLMGHVREQNWFAVGLDLGIVVVGVFIGIQVANWNEARRENAAEHRYLTELARDLEADIQELNQGKRSTLARLATSEAILLELDPDHHRPSFFAEVGVEAVPVGLFSEYAYAALTSTFTVVGTDYTFNELVQSGKLGVLSNRALVNQLAAYYGKLKRRREEDRIAFEQIEPILGYFRQNGLSPGDRATLEQAVRLAEVDQHFLGLVKMAHFLSLWQYGQFTPILAEAEAALAFVQTEIEVRR
jgi:hypothetical protein